MKWEYNRRLVTDIQKDIKAKMTIPNVGVSIHLNTVVVTALDADGNSFMNVSFTDKALWHSYDKIIESIVSQFSSVQATCEECGDIGQRSLYRVGAGLILLCPECYTSLWTI